MTGSYWGRVTGHARNSENRRKQHRENRSAHLATIEAPVVTSNLLQVNASDY